MSERRFKVFEERRLLFTHTAAPHRNNPYSPFFCDFSLAKSC